MKEDAIAPTEGERSGPTRARSKDQAIVSDRDVNDAPAATPRRAEVSRPRRATAAAAKPAEVRIGSVEVRIAPPPKQPPTQPQVVAAPAPPAAPLARGFASSIGLRQG